MKKSNRLTSAALLLLVLFILFASFYFVLHESHHDCTGEDCPVCRLIFICRNTLKSFALALVLFASLLSSLRLFKTSLFAHEIRYTLSTPVSLKVRLLD